MPKAKRLFRIDDVNATREITQVATSPDGTLTVLSVAETAPDGTKTAVRLWIVDASAPEGARPITRGDRRASSAAFSADGKRLAFLAEGEKEKVQLAVLTTPFSEAIVLTNFEQGVRSFEWLDAKRLLVLAPTDRPEAKRRAVESKDDAYVVEGEEPRARMWVVSAEGARPRPLGPADGHVALASVSPDGKLIAYIHGEHSTLECLWRGAELRLLDVRTGRSRRLRKLHSPHASGQTPRFSPDGSLIAYVDSPRKHAVYPYYVCVTDPAGRRVRRVGAESSQVQTNAKWLDAKTLLFVEQRGVRRALCAAAPGGSSREIVRLPGSVGDFAVGLPRRSSAEPGAGSRVAFVYSESAKPPELFDVSATGLPRSRLVGTEPGATEPRKLTAINRRLDAIALAPGEIVRWKSREGWTVEGLLHRPTTKSRGPVPCCVVPHGGPHGAICNAWERPIAQVLAARGVASFFPNFRGSTGYGEKFLLSIIENWGAGPADYILRGVDALARARIIDRRRLVVQGGSYGGYMTAWLIGHSSIFRAAVAHAPVVNNISMWGTTDIPVFKEWSYGGSPLGRPEVYWKQSPIAHLARCRVPTLVIVGDKDERVPPGQAQELYRTLKSAGARTQLVRYPREPHGIGEPRHKADSMRRIVAWLEEHMEQK